MDDAAQVQVTSRAEWRAWLEQHYEQADGVWVVRFKQHCGENHVSYDELVEEALCFGWIDSRPRKLDADRTMLWMTPRKPGSKWSRINKQRIEALTETGLMMPAGQHKIDQAKADGSWNALDAIDALEIPDDLRQALAEYAEAAEHFENFPPSVKRGLLEWISDAKRPQTRAKRIAETARLAQDNIRANQWRK